MFVKCTFEGDLGKPEDPALTFLDAQGAPEIRQAADGPLESKAILRLRLRIRSSGAASRLAGKRFDPAWRNKGAAQPAGREPAQWHHDRRTWIFRKLVQLPKGRRSKPAAEQAHELRTTLRVAVLGRDDRAKASRTIFDKQVPIFDGVRRGAQPRDVAVISYPDFRPLVDRPQGDADMQHYYAEGDTRFETEFAPTTGNPYVRALALRAARFGARWKDVRHANDESVLMPEDPEQVVRNVGLFVFHALKPKDAPAVVYEAHDNAEGVWKRHYGFGIDPPDEKWSHPLKTKGPTFVCQENAQLFGQLLRALGFPVRDINVMCFYFPWNLGVAREVYQDACSEVWVGGRWWFWGLYAKPPRDAPFHDPIAWYGKEYLRFDVYEGVRQFHNDNSNATTRFNVGETIPEFSSRVGWASSDVWRFRATWSKQAGWQTPEAIEDKRKAELLKGELWELSVFSPVAAEVELPDGRRLGMRTAPQGDARRWLLDRGSPGLAKQVPGGIYVPEGLPVSVGDSVRASPQRLRFPLPKGIAPKDVTLRLTPTGSGPYRIRLQRLSKQGIQHHAEIHGVAEPGSVETLALAEFKPKGDIEPWPEPRKARRAAPSAQEAEATARKNRPYLGIASHSIDPMTARLFGVPEDSGVILSNVTPGSPAEALGLVPHVVITHMNGEPVRSHVDVVDIIRRHRPGDAITIRFFDGQERKTVLAARGEVPPLPAMHQEVLLNHPMENISRRLGELQAKGYRLTSLAGQDGLWSAFLSREYTFALQAFQMFPDLTAVNEGIPDWWASGWHIREFEFSGQHWAAWFEKTTSPKRQRVTSYDSRSDLATGIRSAWKDGFRVTNLTHGGGSWIAVFTRDSGLGKQSFVHDAEWEPLKEKVRRQWKKGRVITTAARNGPEWFVVCSARKGVRQSWLRRRPETLSEGIQESWEDGYWGTLHCSGSGTTFLTFIKPR